MPTLEIAKQQQTIITPAHENYRHLPIQEGFDFPEIIRNTEKIRGRLAGEALYLVVFRSKLAPGADKEKIKRLDDAAHQEALAATEDFFAYFQGERDEEEVALSMCLWRSARAAFEAVHGQKAVAHKEAEASAEESYGGNYSIEMHSLIPAPEGILFIEHKHPQSKEKAGAAA